MQEIMETQWHRLDDSLKVESTGILILMGCVREVFKNDLRVLAVSSSNSGIVSIFSM